jgi:hypothetical protein
MGHHFPGEPNLIFWNFLPEIRSESARAVGIGTTSPATTFSVVGTDYLTGGLGVGTPNHWRPVNYRIASTG